MAYNNYNKELAEFQKWACLVRNDRLISTSKNKNQVRNCKDLLIKLKNDPMNIDNFLKDEDRKNIFPESREYQMGKEESNQLNFTFLKYFSKYFKEIDESHGGPESYKSSL